MTTHGRIYHISSDSTAAPPVTRQQAEMDIVGALAIHNIRLAAENERLRTALDALIMAVEDAGGLGLRAAVKSARRARK